MTNRFLIACIASFFLVCELAHASSFVAVTPLSVTYSYSDEHLFPETLRINVRRIVDSEELSIEVEYGQLAIKLSERLLTRLRAYDLSTLSVLRDGALEKGCSAEEIFLSFSPYIDFSQDDDVLILRFDLKSGVIEAWD